MESYVYKQWSTNGCEYARAMNFLGFAVSESHNARLFHVALHAFDPAATIKELFRVPLTAGR